MTKTETLGLVARRFLKFYKGSSVKIRIIGAETLNIWKGQG